MSILARRIERLERCAPPDADFSRMSDADLDAYIAAALQRLTDDELEELEAILNAALDDGARQLHEAIETGRMSDAVLDIMQAWATQAARLEAEALTGGSL